MVRTRSKGLLQVDFLKTIKVKRIPESISSVTSHNYQLQSIRDPSTKWSLQIARFHFPGNFFIEAQIKLRASRRIAQCGRRGPKIDRLITSLKVTLQGRRSDGRITTLDERSRNGISFLPSDNFMEQIKFNVDMTTWQQELQELIFKFSLQY